LAVGIVALALAAFAVPALAQDSVVAQASAQGLVGEQTDGFLGFPSESGVSADLRARVDQINIRRRAVYTQRAAENGATASEMAAAVACQIFRERIAVGEKYRDEGGAWRTHTAAQPVAVPSFCN
jgi:uncharacterized protein YdbL (DUF1318 family)